MAFFSAAGWLKSLTVLSRRNRYRRLHQAANQVANGHAEVSQDSTDLAVRARAVIHGVPILVIPGVHGKPVLDEGKQPGFVEVRRREVIQRLHPGQEMTP